MSRGEIEQVPTLSLCEIVYSLTEYEAGVLQRALADLAAEDVLTECDGPTAMVLLERANDQLPAEWRGGEESVRGEPRPA